MLCSSPRPLPFLLPFFLLPARTRRRFAKSPLLFGLASSVGLTLPPRYFLPTSWLYPCYLILLFCSLLGARRLLPPLRLLLLRSFKIPPLALSSLSSPPDAPIHVCPRPRLLLPDSHCRESQQSTDCGAVVHTNRHHPSTAQATPARLGQEQSVLELGQWNVRCRHRALPGRRCSARGAS